MARVLCEKDYHVFATLRDLSKAGTLAILSNVEVLQLDAKKYFDSNFWGVLAVTQAFAPMVIRAKGVIANHRYTDHRQLHPR
ncbi:hypothetical protein F5Y04DRAFT_285923 [Hypomontagnella monticulosa]|nr:hypothetical protein F5Y04DRAFT_285923 [Hypomontagnella monticulosa]